ncbi:hypothetical protein T440DRAFT_482792 [Plenodomus tracheiphilus IPT5]|uniref:Uncharacterized protein n=1 Tax=Plenodomus tracheiphilus IPT5 TaxID=1408161 RepID=A0A6A7AT77_9PLEO|nr:hypothetical protein T440DRAFT_482792 [Plenodomus tracheiphilus IPT5]
MEYQEKETGDLWTPRPISSQMPVVSEVRRARLRASAKVGVHRVEAVAGCCWLSAAHACNDIGREARQPSPLATSRRLQRRVPRFCVGVPVRQTATRPHPLGTATAAAPVCALHYVRGWERGATERRETRKPTAAVDWHLDTYPLTSSCIVVVQWLTDGSESLRTTA